jgi:hypothetical protein
VDNNQNRASPAEIQSLPFFIVHGGEVAGNAQRKVKIRRAQSNNLPASGTNRTLKTKYGGI